MTDIDEINKIFLRKHTDIYHCSVCDEETEHEEDSFFAAIRYTKCLKCGDSYRL